MHEPGNASCRHICVEYFSGTTSFITRHGIASININHLWKQYETDLNGNTSSRDTSELRKPNFLVPSIVFDTGSSEHYDGGDDENSENSLASTLNGTSENGDESILQIEASDVLDDYLEDFILPHSHESVMSRQLSFRRKVQKQLESAAAERAVEELDRFEAMLSTYDGADEFNHRHDDSVNGASGRLKANSRNRAKNKSNSNNNLNSPHNKMDTLSSTSSTPTGDSDLISSPPVPKSRAKSQPKNAENGARNGGNFIINGNMSHPHHRPAGSYGSPKGFPGVGGMLMDPEFDMLSGAPISLDIDAIVKENAPNLMGSDSRKNSGTTDTMFDTIHEHGPEESMSSYFLPQPTLDKLCAVYESSNFNNIYCLSGELKDILTPAEIEEIVANKDQLEKFIDPNVMAALSWTLNEASLPYMPPGINSNSSDPSIHHQNKLNVEQLEEDGEDDQENESSLIDRTDLGIIENGLKPGSKSSSLSNGFHSDASEDDMQSNDDTASSTSSSRLEVPNDEDNEMRCSSSNSSTNNDNHSTTSANKRMGPANEKYSSGNHTAENNSTSDNPDAFHDVPLRKARRVLPNSPTRSSDGDSSVRRGNSQESLETDLGVCEDDWEDDEDDTNSKKSSSSGVVLVRRDSKRCSFKGKDGQVDRIVEGLFVESKNPNPNGTLRRIRAPLNLTEDIDGDDGLEGSSLGDEKKKDEEEGSYSMVVFVLHARTSFYSFKHFFENFT